MQTCLTASKNMFWSKKNVSTNIANNVMFFRCDLFLWQRQWRHWNCWVHTRTDDLLRRSEYDDCWHLVIVNDSIKRWDDRCLYLMIFPPHVLLYVRSKNFGRASMERRQNSCHFRHWNSNNMKYLHTYTLHFTILHNFVAYLPVVLRDCIILCAI